MHRRVLLVEDDRFEARTLQLQLHALGLEAHHELTGAEGLDYFQRCRPNLVLISADLPGCVDGLDAGACMRGIADLSIIYLTRTGTSPAMRSRLAATGARTLEKPCALDRLIAALQPDRPCSAAGHERNALG